MADITASTTLDNSQFSRGLQDALKQARTFRTNVTRTLNFNPLERLEKSAAQVNTTFARIRKAKIQVDTSQAERGLAKLGTAATTVRRQTGQTVVGMRQLDAAVKANANQIRNLEAAYNRGEVETGAFIRQMSTLRGVAQGLSTNLDQDSSALVRLNANLKRADTALASANDKTNTVAQAVIRYRNATLALRNEVEAGVISQEDAIETARRLRDESLAAAQGAERWSTEYRQLLVASGRADRTISTLEGRVTKLGLSQNVAIGSTQRLTNALGGMQQVMQGLLGAFGAAGAAGLLRAFRGAADGALTAQLAIRRFTSTVGALGGSLDTAERRLFAFADAWDVPADVAAKAAETVLQAGLSFNETMELLEAGAALGLDASMTVAEGLDNVASAISSGRGGQLRAIGVVGTAAQAYRAYAEEIGKASSDLNDVERSQALANAAVRRAEPLLKDGERSTTRYADAANAAATAQLKFRDAVGEAAQPLLTVFNRAISTVLNAFTALPGVLQTAAITVSLLAAGVTGLTGAYLLLSRLLLNHQTAAAAVTAVLRNETVLRSGLGRLLLRTAARYKLLTREQLRHAVAARRSAGATTLLGGALRGLRGGLNAAITGMRRLTVASLRFIATPVGAVLTAIAATVALITTAVRRNRAVVEPAFEAFADLGRMVLEALQPLIQAFRRLTEEGGLLNTLWRTVLARTAQVVALSIGKMVQVMRELGAAFQLVTDITTGNFAGAWTRFRERVDGAGQDFQSLAEEINAATRAAIDGTAATSAWGDAADDAGEQAAGAAEEVEKLRRQLEERLRGIEISLIEDDQAREVAEVRREFETLREEIREAGRENPDLEIFGFLSRSYELERQKIAQIQERYDRQQADEARRQTEELQDALQERQRALEDAQLAGRANEAQLLQVEYERRIEDTNALYDDLIGMARKYGRDTSELEETRTRELLAIQEAHARKVRELWSELQSDIADFQADVARQSLEGDERALLAFDYGQDLRDLEDRLTEFRERAAGNAELLRQAEETGLQARQQLLEDYWDNVMTLTRERGEELADLERDLRLNAARLADDSEAAARIENEARLAQIEREYDQRAAAAEGNAQELRRIEALRAEAIRQSNEQLAQDVRKIEEEAARERIETQEQAAAAIIKGEADLRRRRAELRGDQVELVQLDWAEERQAILDRYDSLIEAEGLGMAQLTALREQRNEQLAALDEQLGEKLQQARDEAAAQTFEPTLDRLTEGLDDASLDVLDTIREQLEGWRAAYGNNGEVVDLIDNALEKVTGRIGQLRDEASKHIESLLSDAQQATSQIFRDDFRDDLSEVETLLADAAERARELRARQSSLLAALPTATDEQRRAILAEVQTLNQAIDLITSSSVKAAEQATREALDAYQEGLKDARREASDAAIDLAAEDIEGIIDGISNVQILALEEARTDLARQIARLTTAGVDAAALAPLRALDANLATLLARQEQALADFASDAYDHLRNVANAVLSEDQARRVAIDTYRELARRRRLALDEAQREQASLEDLQEAQRGLTNAQVAYMQSLQAEVGRLQDVQGAYRGVFSAARDLAGLLGEAVPPEVADAQRELAEASLESVRTLQQQGATFAEYRGELQDATQAWSEYQAAQEAALAGEFDRLAQQQARGLFDAWALTDLAREVAETYAISYGEARQLLVAQLRRAAAGEDVDPFAGLDLRQPEVLSTILESLNDEAARTPDTIEQIDEEIQTLEEQVRTLKDEIAAAVNFDAAGEQLVSGYASVLEDIESVTGETFAEAADLAIAAFIARFGEKQQELRDELDDVLGPIAEQAGLTAGEGLIGAFAQGVRDATASGKLQRAIMESLRRIRELLPSSDAKRGPLSDLSYSGQMFSRTLGAGMLSQKGWLEKNVSRLLGNLTPNAAFRAATAPAMAGAGGPVMVNVDGRQQAAPGGLAVNARQLVSSVERELAMRGLKKGS